MEKEEKKEEKKSGLMKKALAAVTLINIGGILAVGEMKYGYARQACRWAARKVAGTPTTTPTTPMPAGEEPVESTAPCGYKPRWEHHRDFRGGNQQNNRQQ